MKPKEETPRQSFQEYLRTFKDQLGTVVDERWWVEEVHYAYNTGGYYGQDVPEEVVSKSKYFDSRENAKEYMDSMVADIDCYLRIRHQVCYERLERTWR